MADMSGRWIQADPTPTFGARSDITSALASGLTAYLSDAFAFYLKAHTAHWNVVGSDFTEYHALFGAIYEDVWGAVDDIAENIRKLGAPVPLDTDTLVSALPAAPDTDPKALAMDLVRYNAALIEEIKDLFDVATEARSQGIANFLADRQDMHEKWQWQLTSSLRGSRQ